MKSQNKPNVKSLVSILNLVFVLHLIIVGLVVVGFLPRSIVPYWTVVLAIYTLTAPLEDSTTFFVRSIPFFVAIPISASFDSLNMWRILSGLIFLKWILRKETLSSIFNTLKLAIKHHREFHKQHQVLTALISLLILAVISMIYAPSLTLAIKRTVYFINLSLIGIVAYDLIKNNQEFGKRLIKNMAIPTILVSLIGMAQLFSTYRMDIFRFVDFWGSAVQRNLYGNAWAETVIRANTWFAYFGDQLSLRMFSIFPDSHSFPIFLLLGLPAVFAASLLKVLNKSSDSLKMMFKTRASMLVVFIPLIFLAAILTGTRGIWAAGGAMLILIVMFLVFTKIRPKTYNSTALATFRYVSSHLVIFFMLFGVAYYVFASDQFQMQKTDSVLGRRIHSLIDIAETSNARRIEIWKASLTSIKKHPLIGVGIGNFPVVVGEDLARAKAGSSAHNLYLHVASEMGLPALFFALWFFWLLLKKLNDNFSSENDKFKLIYHSSLLIFLPWVLIYSLTDVAIFDERAFLLFAVTASIIFSNK